LVWPLRLSSVVATLYVVSTPIGNLGDLSIRAAEILCSVYRVLSEDTRRTRVLINHISSDVPLVSLHAHNEEQRISRVLEWLEVGKDLALVSDAGTPLISDPGARLVSAAIRAGYVVIPIPGPSAVLASLVASGLTTSGFSFYGFPQRKGRRRARLMEIIHDAEHPVVLFESPQRLAKLLNELSKICGINRSAAVARELTKVHENIHRGTLGELYTFYRDHVPKGEVTIVISGIGRKGPGDIAEDRSEEARALAGELEGRGMKVSEAAKEVASRLDLSRNEAYRIVLETRKTIGEV
jgi:16S rRNA (cytidine1402-2'-O)-methyltransferase